MNWLSIILTGLVAGLSLTAAMPPLGSAGWWPLLFLAVPLFWQQCRLASKKRQAFAIGLATGFIHYLSSLSWITGAVKIGGEQFAALVPIALIGIPTALSLYLGITALLIQQAQRRFGTTVCWLVSPVLWVAIEYSRLFGLPFPWLPLGTVWMAALPMAQLASVIGVYGLSILTFLTASSVALWWRRWPVLLSLALLAGQFGFGQYRLATAHKGLLVAPFFVRLVQPNIQQQLKWAPGQQQANLDTLIALSLKKGTIEPQLIIWPESAFPGDLATARLFRQELAAILGNDSHLVIGSNRWSNQQTAYNSLFLLNPQGDILATYDKHQLVPFGEYVPFRRFLQLSPIAGKQASTMGDFSRGSGPRTIMSKDIPSFSPLICYEGIFSGVVTGSKNGEEHPWWLLNITNDGWYGDTLGPYQHAAMVRLRGIEEGLPVVRVANTGISFVSNRYGRYQAILGYGTQGVLDIGLNTSTLFVRPTPFSQYGNKIPGLLALFLLLLAVIPRHSKRV